MSRVQRVVAAATVSILALAGSGRALEPQDLLPGALSLGGDAGATGAAGAPVATTVPPGAVDPSTYALGPGDQLEILILGDAEERRFEWVGPSGSLTVTPGGALQVDGLSVAEAERQVAATLQRYYPGAEIQVRLRNTRTFRVRLAGAVPFPGEFLATPFTRVTDVLDEALGKARVGPSGLRTAQIVVPEVEEEERLAEQEPEAAEEAAPIAPEWRRVYLHRAGEPPRPIDAAAARLGWPGAENPVLRGGDRLVIPSDRQLVRIDGAVYAPGVYELLAHDSALDLLRLAGGVTAEASEFILIKRAGRNGDRVITNAARAALAEIEPGDHIFVPSSAERRAPATVTVEGAVRFPGQYPLLPDEDTVRDILLLAGGFTAEAVSHETYVMREGEDLRLDPTTDRIRMTPRAIQEHGEFEYQLQRRMLAARVIYVALDDLDDPSENPLLRAGDAIRVPSRDDMVYVSGAVMRPGGYARLEGAGFAHYVERAGGTTDRADRSERRLVAGSTGQWLELDDETPIRPGDTIWIPGKEPRDYWQLFRELVAVVGQVATTYLVIDNIVKG